MGAKADYAQRIVGQPGKFSGLNNFLDVQAAFKKAQQDFTFNQQLAREQGFTSGAASIINSSNLYGTDSGPALKQFAQAAQGGIQGALNAPVTQGAGGIASGAAPAETTSGQTATVGGNGNSSTDNSGRDEAYLSKLTPARQALVKQYADYRGDPARLRGNPGIILSSQVAQYDKNFDSGTYSQRQAFINTNWNKGDLFKNRQAIENTVQHLELLQNNFDKINNGKLLVANAAGNTAKVQTGNSQVTNAMIDAKAVGTEMAKALRGAGVLNEQEQKDMQSQLSASSSPEQLHGAVEQMIHLIKPRINSALETYKGVMGRYPKNAFSPELNAALKTLSPSDYAELAPKLGVEEFVNAGNQASASGDNSNLQSLKDKYGLQ